MGNINQTDNSHEEWVHKQKVSNANPFASYGPTTHPNFENNTQTNNAQPNQSMTDTQGSNASGGMFKRSNPNNGNNGILVNNQGMGNTGFQNCPPGQGFNNSQGMNLGNN
eukprot:Gb_09039 [translate_table: standard]